jgi:DHA1 family inner membrane transport protein
MSSSEPASPTDADRLSRGQWLLLFILAAVQFSHTIDFVIIMPLEPRLTADLGIGSRQFGLVVSAYGWAAFAGGLLLAPWLDTYDRKRTLLLLFAGFTLGTLLCGIAPDYSWLLVGRAIAGGFGGIVAATVLAIVGDAFPDHRRGMATGVVMSAFSISSIVGIPAGLMLAGNSATGWRAPFLALAIGCGAVWLLSVFVIPSLRGHLRSAQEEKPSVWQVLARPAHLKAFGVMLTLVFGNFLVVPYIPAFLVKNIGVGDRGVQLMYFLGGLATLGTMNVVGRLADRFPRLLLFRILGLLALVTVVILPQLPTGTPLAVVLTVTTLMFILMSGRYVPLMALVTGIAPPRERGAFMSLLASVQQLGLGMAPFAAALLMHDTPGDQPLEGFANAGLASAAVGLLALWLAGMLTPCPAPVSEPEAQPLPDEDVALEATAPSP